MSDPLVCACGGEHFFESVRVSGWWKRLLDGAGDVVDTDLESVHYGATPKTVTCAECGRRHRHPRAGTMELAP